MFAVAVDRGWLLNVTSYGEHGVLGFGDGLHAGA